MIKNNFGSVWVSHSSISDFLKCPKSYYLHHVYKNPRGQKITLINPALSLGQSVHEVLESLASKKVEERLKDSLLDKFEEVWKKFSGKKGGFKTQEDEEIYKKRGIEMIKRVIENPGPILNKALKLQSPDALPPRFNISEENNIILCGKIDWLEYVPENDSVHIIDFKTGKHDEDPNSLQLGIYCLLVENLQKRKIHKVSYWYLDKDNQPLEKEIPNSEKAKEQILSIALIIKNARLTRSFECPRNGCYACKPYQAIINGEAEFVGSIDYQDVYLV